jgi:predicted anti-sigma-YlaC factor YlaD
VVGGKSPAAEDSLVREHLLHCPSCSEEADRLRHLIEDIGRLTADAPPHAYWTSVLPRIHSRIDERSAGRIPAWATRFVLPAAAALVIVAFLVNGDILNGTGEMQEITTLLRGLSAEEIQQVADLTTYSAENVAVASADEEPRVSAADKEVLKQLFESEGQSDHYAELDADEALGSVSAQEEDELLAMLQQEPTIN